jgi:D-alanyl-lipoteichoic acid acyltransferase DltB (MBOAT superfamily)
MLFNSFRFLVFLPVVLAIYYPLPHKAQNRFLLLASLFFYASWDWRFLAPLLMTTSIDFWCARCMGAIISVHGLTPARKPYLILSVVANLGLLGFFKYFDFFASSAGDLFRLFGGHLNPWTLRVILPVGISFYTFQALSYTIDVYRGQMHASSSYLDFLLAVLYFPHLVAGPIQRANSLLPQVTNPRHPTSEGILAGVHLITWGYFKKVYIADNLAPLVDQLFSLPHPGGFQALLAGYAFAFQIYCDFSGYTDIARGVAKLMGFEFMINFHLPYFSRNPKEFWSRWHISLSTWMRDYLYIPLGGGRRGRGRMFGNLMITMILAGLWHGAAWTFVLWGTYHGVLLVAYHALEPALSRAWSFRPRHLHGLFDLLCIVVFFHLTCYGWLIFRARSLGQLAAMTAALTHPLQNLDLQLASRVAWLAAPLVLIQIIQGLSRRADFLSFRWVTLEVRAACYAVLSYVALFRGGAPKSFIYFQF